MAVRVRLMIAGTGGEIASSAVLNGGFEVEKPHLLLPVSCADRLLGDWRPNATRQAMDAAGGEVELLAVDVTVKALVKTNDREGKGVEFHVIVSEADEEVLVSDSGIDALGVRIESFVPGRWRFADETATRETEAPQYW